MFQILILRSVDTVAKIVGADDAAEAELLNEPPTAGATRGKSMAVTQL